jgi:Holliday junction resolvasome RuvABC endonuclease subunit
MTPRVVGIDSSLTATAVVRSDGGGRVFGQKGISALVLGDQVFTIEQIVAEIRGFVLPFQPDMVVIEHPNMATPFGANFLRAPLWFQIVRSLLPYRTASIDGPMRWQYLLGRGSGVSKKQVVAGVHEYLPDLAAMVGKDDNLADAAVYMAMGMHRLRHPIMEDTHQRCTVISNTKARWPDPGLYGCQEQTCPNLGSLDYAEGACPSEHAFWPVLG